MMSARIRTTTIVALIVCGDGTIGRQADATPMNLAVSGNATASSMFAPAFGASQANNNNRLGDNSDIWHTSNSTTDPFWWEVDLGADFYLDRIQIHPRTSAVQSELVKNFRIDVHDSSNALVFTQQFLPTEETGAAAWGTTALRNVLGSRVRITRDPPHVSGFDDAMTFAEFEVWGQSTPNPVNLAEGRPVTSTPSIAGGLPEYTVDGNISGSFGHQTVYHADPNDPNQFLQVELDALTAVSQVNIFNRSDFTGNTKEIRLSILAADGVTVVDAVDTTLDAIDLGAARYDLTHLFAGNPVGKYVRIDNMAADPAANALVFSELEVFGTAVPEVNTIGLLIIGVIVGTISNRRRG